MENILLTILALLSIILTTYMISFSLGWSAREKKMIQDEIEFAKIETAMHKIGKHVDAGTLWDASDDAGVWIPEEQNKWNQMPYPIQEPDEPAHIKDILDEWKRNNLN